MASQDSLKFKSTATMVDCLTALPPSDISNIRSIRLKSFSFPIYTDEDMLGYTTYNMGTTLSLFPGLALDLLTAEDCYHDPGINDGWGNYGTYYDIQTLIESNGWKELHYFTPTTEFLTVWDDEKFTPLNQPAGWDKLLKEKDGEDSGAEVRMFVAKEPGMSAADPQTSVALEVIPGNGRAFQETHRGGNVVDAREVLIVAKRGRDAAYVQDGSDLDKDLKDLWSRMSWEEIKESGRYLPSEDDPCAHL